MRTLSDQISLRLACERDRHLTHRGRWHAMLTVLTSGVSPPQTVWLQVRVLLAPPMASLFIFLPAVEAAAPVIAPDYSARAWRSRRWHMKKGSAQIVVPHMRLVVFMRCQVTVLMDRMCTAMMRMTPGACHSILQRTLDSLNLAQSRRFVLLR